MSLDSSLDFFLGLTLRFYRVWLDSRLDSLKLDLWLEIDSLDSSLELISGEPPSLDPLLDSLIDGDLLSLLDSSSLDWLLVLISPLDCDPSSFDPLLDSLFNCGDS